MQQPSPPVVCSAGVLCATSGRSVRVAVAACCDHIPINLAPVHLHSALPLEAFFYAAIAALNRFTSSNPLFQLHFGRSLWAHANGTVIWGKVDQFL